VTNEFLPAWIRMMIRPGSVMTVRPPSWTSWRWLAEVVEPARSLRLWRPGAIGVNACAGGGAAGSGAVTVGGGRRTIVGGGAAL